MHIFINTLNYLKEIGDLKNLAIAYFYLGKIYKIEGLQNKMVVNFKRVDSIFKKTNYIYPETRPAYESLIKFYENKNDIKNQLIYIKKLLKVDSILYKRYRSISENIYVEYDKNLLINEKNRLEENLDNTKKSFFFKNILYAISLFIISILLIVYYRRNIIYKRRFEELIKEENNKEVKKKSTDIQNKKNDTGKLNLDENLVNNVLKKLDDFEENHGFLEKGLTVRILAEKCDTNSKYLSKIINNYKKKNFRNYINNLRIDYTINRIKNDENFRNYKIVAIADEVGFSNSESYAKAFYSRTGIHTSYFIKQLKNKID